MLLARAALIVLPLIACGLRVQDKTLRPDMVTQEVARCLRVVAVAAGRRDGRPGENESRPLAPHVITGV